MIVVLSPTKKQRHRTQHAYTQPLFLFQAQKILELLQSKSHQELKALFKISDKLTASTYDLIHDNHITPALYLYEGEAFKALNPQTFTQETLDYANDHCRIFSSVYGLLRPMDGIQSYRLDFLTPFELNLKELWSGIVTESLNSLNAPIINCASKEFSQLMNRKQISNPIYDIEFLTKKADQPPKILSTHSKRGRGLFTRYILENQITTLEGILQFNLDGYQYTQTHMNTIQFVKEVQ